LTAFDVIIVQIQRSFIKTKTQNNFFEFLFWILQHYINHLAQHSMIKMTLKWHHKNISNKITILTKLCGHPTCFLACLIMIVPMYSSSSSCVESPSFQLNSLSKFLGLCDDLMFTCLIMLHIIILSSKIIVRVLSP